MSKCLKAVSLKYPTTNFQVNIIFGFLEFKSQHQNCEKLANESETLYEKNFIRFPRFDFSIKFIKQTTQ